MRLSIAEAAEIMGVSKAYIRVGLQRGLLPFGTAIKMSSRYTYYIPKSKFYEYMGVSENENSAVDRAGSYDSGSLAGDGGCEIG